MSALSFDSFNKPFNVADVTTLTSAVAHGGPGSAQDVGVFAHTPENVEGTLLQKR